MLRWQMNFLLAGAQNWPEPNPSCNIAKHFKNDDVWGCLQGTRLPLCFIPQLPLPRHVVSPFHCRGILQRDGHHPCGLVDSLVKEMSGLKTSNIIQQTNILGNKNMVTFVYFCRYLHELSENGKTRPKNCSHQT